MNETRLLIVCGALVFSTFAAAKSATEKLEQAVQINDFPETVTD